MFRLTAEVYNRDWTNTRNVVSYAETLLEADQIATRLMRNSRTFCIYVDKQDGDAWQEVEKYS